LGGAAAGQLRVKWSGREFGEWGAASLLLEQVAGRAGPGGNLPLRTATGELG